MKCPQCQHENPAGVKFCGGCGARLEFVCPGCGAANPPANRFCHECGASLASAAPEEQFASPGAYTPKHLAQKILTSRGALEGERKQVTVLFVDVSGFTRISERLDPEDVHRLMTRAFELMLGEVHRYEGTVNQFLGDGIMALFGAPIAHEDHAQRAVHAALGIRKALDAYRDELSRERGIGFQVRQGLNTGLVVVGSIGDDLRMDYTAVGDTTNVAARLQQAADPGRIVISEATHRLVGGFFHTRPLGELALKGKSAPVRAWEVISARAARTRFEIEAERGLTPLVGRERELRLLSECFEKAKAGHGQVVFLVGEPGIGKSRLLYEFRRRLGEEATWLEGHAVSFGRSIAFHPIIDLVRRNFRIEEGDTEEVIIRKIERSVLLLGEDLRPILPFLRHLLSVDPGDPTVTAMDPRQRRGEIFQALRRLLVRAADIRPQVLVHEDIHWMDQATEDYLRFITDSVPTSRVLHILTYRTGYVQPLGERTYHTRIALDTLSSDESVRIAQSMLGAEGLPEDLNALIVRKAEGNPFFVEEVVKSLQEIGAVQRAGDRYVLARRLDEILVPDTIQDVIMARIDRLEEAPKKTLQLASVIGREFTRRLIDRLAEVRERTEDFLRELKAIELIYEKGLFPELAYMFKHALTHEVAYGSLLVNRRKELHRLIARAVEELYADRLAEQYEVLAHHFSKAEEWTKALDYLLKAADKAGRAFALRESLSLYDQALEVAGHLGGTVPLSVLMQIRQTRSAHYFALGEFANAQAEAEQWVASARQAGDRGAEAAALAQTSSATQWAHDFDQALVYAEQAIKVAQEAGASAPAAGASAPAARAHLTIGHISAVSARLDQAKQQLDRAIAISRSAGDPTGQSMALQMAALLKGWQGNYAEADELGAEGVRIAREKNLLSALLRGLWAHALVLGGKGDYEGALGLFEEGLALAQKVGDEAFFPRFLNSIGWVLGECEDLDRAVETSAAASERARSWRHAVGVEMTAYSEINRADALMAKGDFTLAGDLLDEIHGIVRDPATHVWMKWRYSIHCFVSLGELWLARGDPARARDFADQALEIAERTNSRKYLIWGWRLRGTAAAARRQWGEAEEALGRALAMAQSIDNPRQLWKTHLAMAQLHTAMKKPESARQAYETACQVIERVKANLRDPRLRAGLERSPLVPEL